MSGGALRARRWDVLVLGGALPGLVASIRLAMSGLRVLLVEEERAARQPILLREPFLLPGPADEAVLDPCLRALGLAMIERRAFETDPLALQVLLPNLRVELGAAAATTEELVAWGLAKPEEARDLVRSLEAAGRAELEALMAAPLVRSGGLRALSRLRPSRAERPGAAALETGAGPGHRPAAPAPRHPRGLPGAVAAARPPLSWVLDAAVRALSNLAGAEPSPEARARLLGALLAGGGVFQRDAIPLRELLRKRFEAVHGEVRTLGCPFEFVHAGDDPGIARIGPDDAWLGRALVINAPVARVAEALAAWRRPAPSFLAGPRPTHRRLAVHLRALSEVVPEGLARRSVMVRDPSAPARETNAISLAVHPSTRGARFTELVASAVVPDHVQAPEQVAELLEAAVTELMPFCEGRFARAPLAPPPVWDDEAALADPEGGNAWPGDVSIRGAGRRPVYVLRREGLAGLGTEGDLLLGWRAGDAIREELS